MDFYSVKQDFALIRSYQQPVFAYACDQYTVNKKLRVIQSGFTYSLFSFIALLVLLCFLNVGLFVSMGISHDQTNHALIYLFLIISHVLPLFTQNLANSAYRMMIRSRQNRLVFAYRKKHLGFHPWLFDGWLGKRTCRLTSYAWDQSFSFHPLQNAWRFPLAYWLAMAEMSNMEQMVSYTSGTRVKRKLLTWTFSLKKKHGIKAQTHLSNRQKHGARLKRREREG